ncbi:MAG: hypothetical protein JSV62_11680 [Promethearchaeota archaeon]|nr:MAG: hypothetical protein JSV62_11680 [Candidatus Lokiarchaeota archaeon]
MKINLDREMQIFILSIIVALVLASLLILIPIWQLIILAGIGAGILNKTMKKGTLSGAIGVFIYWLIYTIHGMITKNTYVLLDQFGALIIGPGFGWLLLILILLLGTLFGALGGAIGSGAMILIKPRFKKWVSKNRDIVQTLDNK